MKKKHYIHPKKQEIVNDPESCYQILSESKISMEEEMKKKQFNKTSPPVGFPDNCVTLDTFLSDLEDYIRNNEKI